MGKKKKKNKKQEPEGVGMTPADLTPIPVPDWLKRIRDVDYPILNASETWYSTTRFLHSFPITRIVLDGVEIPIITPSGYDESEPPEPPSAFRDFFDNWSDDD